LGQEGARRAGCAALVQGDDHQKGIMAHGYKSLTAERMPFQKVEHVGQAAQLGLEEADPGATIREVERCAVMVAAAKALIDELVRVARAIEQVSKRGEGGGRQRLCGDLTGHAPSLSKSRNSAMRST
jgi:hypothetical protein